MSRRIKDLSNEELVKEFFETIEELENRNFQYLGEYGEPESFVNITKVIKEYEKPE